MALETGTYISDLVVTNPLQSDPKSQGDDHIRLIKATLKTTFPSITGSVTATHAELSYASGVTSAIQTQLNTISTAVSTETTNRTTADNLLAPLASPALTGTPTAPTATPGTNTTQIATMAALQQQAFSAILPIQAGHAGNYLSTDGTNASWIGTTNQITILSKSSGYTVLAADRAVLIDCTSSFTLAFTAAATLTNGWYCYVRNSGTGDILVDPNGSETIDGLTSFTMFPGEARLVICTGSLFNSIVLNGFVRAWSSSTTFVIPPGYKKLGHRVISGSGGGGSGMRSDTAVIFGGGGGGGAGRFDGILTSPTSGATVTVTVGSFGTGGAAVTVNDTVGNTGTSGGDSSLSGGGFNITVTGGKYGYSGDTSGTSGSFGGGVGASFSLLGTACGFRGGSSGSTVGYDGEFGGGSSGAYANNGLKAASGGSIWGGGGGGGGCGYNTSATSVAAYGTSTYGCNGGAGGAVNTAGSVGSSSVGLPGGGGGGGGASRNGTNSGAGGNGVAGYVMVWGIV
jgi:hypothetical protein